MALEVGSEIGGYRIEALLSQGGMGAVYRAIQVSVDREVALKTLLDDKTNSKSIERFKMEAKVLAKINHPNVVQVLDLREEQGMLFIAMELVEGVDLSVRLREAGPLEETVALEYLKSSALALAAAADKGIVHRDLKPSNIMLATDGTLKITDFGIAKSSFDSGITRAGALLGTPDYMPPEQIDGDEADTRSDIYALGASFYHMISGKPPFKGKSFTDILLAHKMEQAMPLTEVARVSPGLSQLIDRCMKKAPEDRPQSARELAEACDKLMLNRLHAKVTVAEDGADVHAIVRRDQIRELALIEYLARAHKLDRGHVEEALKVQRDAGGETMALEEILIDKGFLQQKELLDIEQDLERLRRVNDNRLVMQLIRKNELLDDAHLGDVEARAEDHGVVLLNFIEKKQWIKTRHLMELQKLVAKHREGSFSHALGQIAVESGTVKKEDLDKLLAAEDGKPLGVRMIESGVVGAEELRALLDVQKLKAVDHFFTVDVIGNSLRLRDMLKCPHCKQEIFSDDEICMHCKAPLRGTTRDPDLEGVEVAELEIVEDFPESGCVWFVKIKGGEKGPLALVKLQQLVITKKITAKHKIRMAGTDLGWQSPAEVRGLARLFGICFSCGNFRKQESGPCDTCEAVEP